MSKLVSLVQGNPDLLVLKILYLRMRHSSALRKRLKQAFAYVLGMCDCPFYPAVRKLEQQGRLTEL